ncbi:YIP1 family protein [Halobacterium litoreum]|uniref:YIP1 family protein n=1 Tax=Halobacterium litoreum TaxID=2039234 RepID=A0ABD5NGK1_9EURY|nr:YIP1 family protein [Halobacterium litoreum]UHH12799.1 YIP1 family protein [Halobacterium litoreum]
MAPRTPLRNPRQYFEAHGFRFGPALAAVGAAVVALAGTLLGFAALFSRRLASAGHGDAADAVWSLVWSELFGAVLALFVGWLLLAGVLHLIALATLSHDGSFGETVAVTGWGTAPSVLSTLFAFVVLAVALDGASLTSPEAFAEQFRSTVASTGVVRAVVSFLVATWQLYVYDAGLAVAFDTDSALLPAALVAYGGWLLSLL